MLQRAGGLARVYDAVRQLCALCRTALQPSLGALLQRAACNTAGTANLEAARVSSGAYLIALQVTLKVALQFAAGCAFVDWSATTRRCVERIAAHESQQRRQMAGWLRAGALPLTRTSVSLPLGCERCVLGNWQLLAATLLRGAPDTCSYSHVSFRTCTHDRRRGGRYSLTSGIASRSGPQHSSALKAAGVPHDLPCAVQCCRGKPCAFSSKPTKRSACVA